MGKKSKFKQLRKLAQQMPVIMTSNPESTSVQGDELIRQGVLKLKNGDKIDPLKEYRQVKGVPTPLNHARKMKEIYNKAGANGVNQYIQSVNQYDQHRQERLKEVDNKEITKEVIIDTENPVTYSSTNPSKTVKV
jgi:hypothetical protein